MRGKPLPVFLRNVAPVHIFQLLHVEQALRIFIGGEPLFNLVPGRQRFVGNGQFSLEDPELAPLPYAASLVRFHRVQRGDTAELLRITDIARGASVGQPGAHVALGSVPVGGEDPGLLFQPVGHHSRPVSGYLMVQSGRGPVAAVMDHIEDPRSGIRSAQGDAGHRRVEGSPGILAQRDRSVAVLLAPVDPDAGFRLADRDLRRSQRRYGAFRRPEHRGTENILHVGIIDLAPPFDPGRVRSGMRMRGRYQDAAEGDAGPLFDLPPDPVAQTGVEVSQRAAEKQGGILSLPESRGGHVQRIVDRRADHVRRIPIEKSPHRRRDILPCGSRLKDLLIHFSFSSNRFPREMLTGDTG